MRSIPYLVAAVAFLAWPNGLGQAAEPAASKLKTSPRTRWTPAEADRELARLRAELIERIKESRDRSEKLLGHYLQEHRRLVAEYEKRRSLYAVDLIARREVAEAEVAIEHLVARIEEVKRWIAEDEIAITEAAMRDALVGLAELPVGGYEETNGLVRFNGSGRWSLADAPSIERFFIGAVGRDLPISARGQTRTHDRLRFDHRDALDVALHPDSAEGRLLIAYLRQRNIPFMAFRNAVPGSSTGAHIHIGRPSLRNLAAR